MPAESPKRRAEQMSKALARWNELPAEAAVRDVISCCGSAAWARELAARRPFKDVSSLVAASDEIWNQLARNDWLEAFSKHPRIGERKAPAVASALSAAWSSQEQRSAAASGKDIELALREANEEYERRFGRVFIVCATDKSAAEILDIL